MTADEPTQIELEEVACPLCGSDEHSLHLESCDMLYHVPGTYRIVRCCQCSHLFLNPQPTLNSLPLCYPDGYGPHDTADSLHRESPAHVGTLTGMPAVSDKSHAPGNPAEQSPKEISRTPWYLSGIVRSIPGLRTFYYWLTDNRSEYVPRPETNDCRAVELGCATGKYLAKLHDAGWKAEGVELVESAAEESRRRGFQVQVGTLESSNFPSDSFDGAFAWHVLEHLPDPKGSLAEFHRVLKNDAWLALSIPNVSCWEPHIFGRMWYLWDMPRHLHFFGPSSIRRLLTEAGFHEVQVIHQRTLLNVVGSLALCLKQRWPRSRLTTKMIDYPNHPTMWGQLLMAPAAIFLALIRQSGRLTVIARCRKPPLAKATDS